MNKAKTIIVATLALASLGVTCDVEAQQQPAQQAAPQLPQAPNMTFFVTSVGPGKGADLGGLEGADQYCQQMAQRHGAGGKTWRAGDDRTCRNWTSSTQGAAMVGHIDRKGLRDDAASRSWNSSHPSRGPDGGCSQADLRSTGGDGLFYCFAAQ